MTMTRNAGLQKMVDVVNDYNKCSLSYHSPFFRISDCFCRFPMTGCLPNGKYINSHPLLLRGLGQRY